MSETIKRGEIYYVMSNYQEEGSEQRGGRPAIIVSNDKNNQHSSVVEIVYLTTRPKADLPTHIDIRSTDRASVALCEQVCSISVERLGKFIAVCTEAEMHLIDAALCISLGVDDLMFKGKPEVKEIVKEVVNEVPVVKEVPKEVPSEKLIKLEAERDVYRNLYEGLLATITQKERCSNEA